jgi:hypothetical protein
MRCGVHKMQISYDDEWLSDGLFTTHPAPKPDLSNLRHGHSWLSMSPTMKALRFHGQKDLRYEDVPLPEVKDGQVKVSYTHKRTVYSPP